MGDASNLQTNFLGGEWSQASQGRADLPEYAHAMNVCRNSIPIEEGSCARRPGTRTAGITRKGAPGRVMEFDFVEADPYNVELTDGHMRFWSGANIVVGQDIQPVLNISKTNPAVVQTLGAHGWSSGDQIVFGFTDASTDTGCYPIFNRQLQITVINNYSFSLSDPVTGAGINGSTFTFKPSSLIVSRVLDLPTPWSNQTWKSLRLVQEGTQAFLLNSTTAPYVLTNTSDPGTNGLFASFSLSQAQFFDGPYLDPPSDGSYLTVTNGTTALVTLAITYPTYNSGTYYALGAVVTSSGFDYTSLVDNNHNNTPASSPTQWALRVSGQVVNGGVGFQSTDVSRMVRLFSEPAAWLSGSTYAAGNNVKYNNDYYTSLVGSNTGNVPDTSTSDWGVSASAAAWTWGRITSVTNAKTIVVQLVAASTDTTVASGNLLNGNTNVYTWRLGLYSGTTGYPTCGTWHESRLWLGGNVPNRFDASNSNAPFNMAPTALDGTVGDANAISYIFNSAQQNQILWMEPDHSGIICGTQGGEWVIQSSTLNDPITPTSCKANRVTKFKCANMEPVRTGMATVFVQAGGQRTIEYISDVYSGKYSGTNIAIRAHHLTGKGIQEIRYVQDKTPVVYARLADGSLAGMTYKRESPFGTQPASFVAWHRHDLGSGRIVESISAGPSVGGNLDTLTMVTNNTNPSDPSYNVRWVELLTDIFDETNTNLQAWQLDGAITPTMADEVTVNGQEYVRFYGLQYVAGKTISAYGGGLDLGDFTVSADGHLDVPINVAGSLFTDAYLGSLSSGNYGSLGVFVNHPAPIPLPPGSGQTILEYIPATSGKVQGMSGSQMLTDWDGGQAGGVGNLYLMTQGNNSATGWRRYLLNNCIEQAEVDTETLFSESSPGTQFVQPPVCLAGDGAIYWYTGTQIVGMTPSTLTLNGNAIPTHSNPTVPVVGTSMSVPRQMVPLQDQGVNYIVSSSLLQSSITGTNAIAILDLDPEIIGGPGSNMAVIAEFTIDESRSSISPGPSFLHNGVQYGSAYALGIGPNDNSWAGPLGLYRVAVSNSMITSLTDPVSLTIDPFCASLGKITPAMIDPQWTHFGAIRGLIYDRTDGNVMFFVHIQAPTQTWSPTVSFSIGNVVLGPDNNVYVSLVNSNLGNTPASSPTDWQLRGRNSYQQQNYLVKVSTANATVLWTVPVDYEPSTDQSLNLCRINYGQYAFLSEAAYMANTSRLYTVNTITGTYSTQDVKGTTAQPGQAYDDTTGYLVCSCTYNSTVSNSPVRQQQSRSIWNTGEWASLGFNGYIAGPTKRGQTYFAPFALGFTFTSQGQRLRSIAPQEAGAANGPALAKTRRQHMFASSLAVTGPGIQFGTNFTNMHAAAFKSSGGQVSLTPLQLYTGVYWDTIEDAYTFDSMACWQITRPQPAIVTALGSFLHTQDR